MDDDIRERFDGQQAQLSRIEKALSGNGQPGIAQRLTRVETTMKSCPIGELSKEVKRLAIKVAKYGAASALVTTILVLLVKYLAFGG